MSPSEHRPPDPATTPYTLHASRTRVALYLLGGGVTPAVRSCLNAHPSCTLARQPYRDRKPGPLGNRPALRRALTDAHGGAFDLLLVDRVSQLSRSIDELAEILGSLDEAGVALHSAAEPTLAPTTPAQHVFLHALGRFADTERDPCTSRIGRWFRCWRVR